MDYEDAVVYSAVIHLVGRNPERIEDAYNLARKERLLNYASEGRWNAKPVLKNSARGDLETAIMSHLKKLDEQERKEEYKKISPNETHDPYRHYPSCDIELPFCGWGPMRWPFGFLNR